MTLVDLIERADPRGQLVTNATPAGVVSVVLIVRRPMRGGDPTYREPEYVPGVSGTPRPVGPCWYTLWESETCGCLIRPRVQRFNGGEIRTVLRRIVVCRDHAEYGCEVHGYLFTAPNRAGIHARSSHGRTLREAIADGTMWGRRP